MNPLVRATAVLAAAGLSVPLWAVPGASAVAADEPAAVGAYFYSAGIDKPEQSPTQPPNLTGDKTDGVAPGHLAVAVRVPDQIDKKSFLSFDLASLPFDAVISKAVVTVPLAKGEDNTQMSPAAAKVRACAANDEGFNGQDGASFAEAPTDDCKAFSATAGDSADKKSYEFDVSTLAATWSVSNNGMSLTVADGALSSPFQVVFLPFDQATIAVTYTAPATEVGTSPEVPLSSEPLPDPGSGLSGDAGSFDQAPAVDTAVAPELALDQAPVVGEPVPGADLAAGPAPQTAGEPAQTEQVASVRPSEVLTPTTSMLLGGLLFAGLLALLSLIMGDARVPAAATAAGSQSRLSRSLQERERSAASARLARA